VPPAPLRVPSQRPLVPSIASITSVANDKGDNEMILGAVHRSSGICLTAEENARKPHIVDHQLKGLWNQSSPHMGSFPPIEVGRIAHYVREGERKKEINKERTGWVSNLIELWATAIYTLMQNETFATFTLIKYCVQILKHLYEYKVTIEDFSISGRWQGRNDLQYQLDFSEKS
jgi:hypothetical protein